MIVKRIAAAVIGLLAICTVGGEGATAREGAAALVGPGPSVSGAATGPGHTFAISGRVSGLYPGVTLAMPLTVSNPTRLRIEITSLTALVGEASRACQAANVSVSQWFGSLVVDPGRKRHVDLTVTMRHDAPDSCKAALFPFAFSGSAVRQ